MSRLIMYFIDNQPMVHPITCRKYVKVKNIHSPKNRITENGMLLEYSFKEIIKSIMKQ